MRHLILLLASFFYFNLSMCDENVSITLGERSSIPDLAPHPDTVNPFEDLHISQKVYIESLFSKAVYNPKCESSVEPIIKPIYFWPGKRIDLKCEVCHRSQVYNGMMKNWAVLREDISDHIINLEQSIIGDKWKILDDELASDFKNSKTAFMPQPDPAVNGKPTPRPSNPSNRPRTQFFQRNGKLIILHPQMDAYGLYRCFDRENRDVIKIAYLLIPNTPLLSVYNWNIHLHQCPNDVKKTKKFHFDEFYQFHFLPAILPKSDDICLTSARALSVASTNEYCEVNTFNEARQPPLEHIIDVANPNSVDSSTDEINLKIFISWSEWSSCNRGESLKTRFGYCHIGKRDMSIIFDDNLNIAKPLKLIHRYIENVEDFKAHGIRLFSGVLADIMNKDAEKPSHCTYFDKTNEDWSAIDEAVIQPIKAATRDTITAELRKELGLPDGFHLYDSICFRTFETSYVNDRGKKVETSFEYGQKIIQNEPC